MITSMKNKIKDFLTYAWANKRRPRIWIPGILIVVLVFIALKPSGTNASYEILAIEPREFVQEVSVTGKVVPAQKVDLGFEYSGRLARMDTSVGALVKKGQSLASLNNADYYAGLQKSQAAYASEQAKLADIRKGNRPESIAIAQSDAEVAAQNVIQAKLDVVEQAKDSYAKADDAIKNKAVNVFSNPRGNNPELTFFVEGNASLRTSLQNQRIRVGEILTAWQLQNSKLNSNTLTDIQLREITENGTLIQGFLNDLNTAVGSVNSSLSSSATFVQYRSDISTARTNVNAAVLAFGGSVTALKNAESALARAKQTLALQQSGSTPEEIKAAEANAQSAAAGVSSAAASLSKTVIQAPFDGIVTRVQYKAGESVASAEPVITLMSDASFEIETFVSENDVPKLRIGQKAKVTLDALGDAVVFEATVRQVDLSETIKDGVVTYRTRLQFDSRDERIKSGLTTNVVVETDRRPGIIKVPQSAIVLSKGQKYVKIAPPGVTVWDKDIDGRSQLVPVTTGMIDKEGDLEILSGVSAGNGIIIKSSAKKE